MKEGAIQLGLLEEKVDFDEISFGEAVTTFSNFLRSIFEEICGEMKVDAEFVKWVDETLGMPALYFSGENVSEALRRRRIEAWTLHDSEAGIKKSYLRALVCCLYEEKSDDGEFYEVPDMMELFFSVLLDIEAGLCQRFRIFFEETHDQRAGSGPVSS
ncbi:hypothetical protein NL30_34515 [Burkholderia contaminans]|uniref:hypothetical protein n=2 Tax=Burkholderia contaminans TaxID=488447 RepID=UPI00064AEF5B|nr:hypothetical protein [Burkholderia contaminans]AKM45001.1 hypothetical protein NL30_34515 [Burkholderia contaminans]